MAELVDASGLSPDALWHAGSSPAPRTVFYGGDPASNRYLMLIVHAVEALMAT